ncbi:hypothetical protein SARC_12175 [Sphaeroforma arctica JP610]|uniref:Uncharacterized protein n=1 Tax=Sphaeroforma arctica JP610 TaxID=667725 RepID=A0A0L0FFN7_9EUKA|nr:hypothetical protein SARC_12175 [Sphaeroforma arctica JP610]KNC75296.1 hypothetical protein SARC_12175 [Sphaeroforma arctica JP610]|eukprot:XP_014149198.1 hypothetical protein SARC_12175 [Sphaeroforma arctica JP610]
MPGLVKSTMCLMAFVSIIYEVAGASAIDRREGTVSDTTEDTSTCGTTVTNTSSGDVWCCDTTLITSSGTTKCYQSDAYYSGDCSIEYIQNQDTRYCLVATQDAETDDNYDTPNTDTCSIKVGTCTINQTWDDNGDFSKSATYSGVDYTFNYYGCTCLADGTGYGCASVETLTNGVLSSTQVNAATTC